MKSRAAALLALLLCAAFFWAPESALAKGPKLEAVMSAGLDNKYKSNEGLPVSITVKNTGDPFSGDLVFDYAQTYQFGAAEVRHLELGAGEEQTIRFALPALYDQYAYQPSATAKMLYFFEGSYESGKEVPYAGKRAIRPSLIQQSTPVVFTLSKSADRVRALERLEMGSEKPVAFHLAQRPPASVLYEPDALSMGGYLFIDEYPLASLSASEQDGILEWVRRGGILIAGDADDIEQAMGRLAPLLPMKRESGTYTVPVSRYPASRGSAELSASPLLHRASLQPGARPVLALDGRPLAAERQEGNGKIIQLAFSIGDRPFSDDPGRAPLLSHILKKAGAVSNRWDTGDEVQMALSSANALFESMRVRPGFLTLSAIAYILLIFPVLYLIVKKRGKHENAWWLIPALAVLTSLAVFGIGARERLGKPQIQQMAALTLDASGSASGYHTEALLSSGSGSASFEAPAGTDMVAKLKRSQFSSDAPKDIYRSAVLLRGNRSSELQLRDIGYWAVSEVYGSAHIANFGKLNADLHLEGGRLKGTIENRFPFRLTSTSIWSGPKLIPLGSVEAGKVLDVDVAFSSPFLFAATTVPMQWKQAPDQALLERQRESLLQAFNATLYEKTTPLLLAETDQPVVPVKFTSGPAALRSLTGIVQPVRATSKLAGAFALPSNAMSVDVTPLSGAGGGLIEPVGTSGREWNLGNGEYRLVWTLPAELKRQSIRWTALQLAISDAESTSVVLRNERTGEEKKIAKNRFVLEKGIEEYISPEGTISFSLIKESKSNDPYTRIPELRLKGEVRK